MVDNAASAFPALLPLGYRSHGLSAMNRAFAAIAFASALSGYPVASNAAFVPVSVFRSITADVGNPSNSSHSTAAGAFTESISAEYSEDLSRVASAQDTSIVADFLGGTLASSSRGQGNGTVIFDAIFNLDAPGLFEVRAESAGSGPLAEWAELHLSLDDMPLLQHSIRMSPLSERIELAHGRYHLRAVVQAASGHVEWIPIGTDPSATHWAEMSFSVRLVPEPASWLLALLAGGCAFGCRTRRRHQTRLRQISSL